jgi:hypothetical protein
MRHHHASKRMSGPPGPAVRPKMHRSKVCIDGVVAHAVALFARSALRGQRLRRPRVPCPRRVRPSRRLPLPRRPLRTIGDLIRDQRGGVGHSGHRRVGPAPGRPRPPPGPAPLPVRDVGGTGTQQVRHGQDDVTVGDGRQHVGAEPLGLEELFLLAGGTKATTRPPWPWPSPSASGLSIRAGPGARSVSPRRARRGGQLFYGTKEIDRHRPLVVVGLPVGAPTHAGRGSAAGSSAG